MHKVLPSVTVHYLISPKCKHVNKQVVVLESESDASTKPSAGRALAFSKVPAEFSPKATAQSKGWPLFLSLLFT